MLSAPDFSKKQLIFVFFREGEKLSFSNDNVVVKDADGKIKLQCSCYRVFLIFAIGHFSVTTALIEKTRKFGFFIALMSPSYRLYELIGCGKDSNTMLKQRQYNYESMDLAKLIVKNKIHTQLMTLKGVRDKNEFVKEAIISIGGNINKVEGCTMLSELMAYEGLSAKLYFKAYFSNVEWKGRKPRLKHDYINSTLDIGYTLLFGFIEALLLSYGFDTYCGVLHRQFYMRKSLVCDMVEPFRTIVDAQIKKSINLKQIKQEDFVVINHQYRLKWEHSPKYVGFIMPSILDSKDEIFLYIQGYYRSFMKGNEATDFPFFVGGK